MRYIILAALLLIAAPAVAQNTSDSRRDSAQFGATRRYSGADYGAPLWRFTYYPTMPKAGERKSGYVYYPYSEYRTDYPRDGYNRNKSARYPVR